MAEKDYYKTLGVQKGASQEEIKAAYKKMAKQLHPDINKSHDSTEKFKELNEAASVLLDEKKRAQYDQFGSDAFKYSPGGQGPGGFSGDFGEEFDFTDIFDQFFGGGFSGFSQQAGGRRRRKGHDLQTRIEINLEETAFGTEKSIHVEKENPCKECEGKGGHGEEKCPDCHGSGTKKTATRTPFGTFHVSSTCSNCHGTGEIFKDECKHCKGHGIVMEKKKLDIKIPAGIDDQTQLRIQGEGAAIKNGPSGDLYVNIRVKKHQVFERDGNDIIIEVPITFVQASLGDEIEIPTLKGRATLKIPSGTQPGTLFKMKGKGIPYMDSFGSGDQYAKVNIQIPEKLNKKQQELLKEFATHSKDKPWESLFDKIKKAF